MVSFIMDVSPSETRRRVLNRCWRSLACASLFFLVLPMDAGAQIETRFSRIGAAATGGSLFEIGGVAAGDLQPGRGTLE